MRWHDQYHVGDTVEALFLYADGPRWVKALIVRKTQSGKLIVRNININAKLRGLQSVECAGDIRKPEHPWDRNLEANVY